MKKLPIAIVGLNFGKYILEDQLAGPTKDFFHLAAVCDLNAEKARAAGGCRNPAVTEHATVPRDEGSGGYQWDVFHRAIHGDHSPQEITPEQIVDGVRVVRAMIRAQQSGQAETL